jgi:HEAT repeat protein
VTPAEALGARGYAPFCAISVLGTIHQLADASHSKDMADLVTAGKWKGELLFTLGKVGPPRYANFIGRYRDDPDDQVRMGVAAGLGLIDNAAVAVPVLIHMLARNDTHFFVKWEAASSLVAVARRRPASDAVRRRAVELLREPSGMTVALAARVLAAIGDARGFEKLRELTAHPDRRVREESVLALGDLVDADAREAVTRRVKDDSVAVRAAAVYALARIGGPPVVPALRQATEEALAYERELEARVPAGKLEAVKEQYGLGDYDLRETLQEALRLTQLPGR